MFEFASNFSETADLRTALESQAHAIMAAGTFLSILTKLGLAPDTGAQP